MLKAREDGRCALFSVVGAWSARSDVTVVIMVRVTATGAMHQRNVLVKAVSEIDTRTVKAVEERVERVY